MRWVMVSLVLAGVCVRAHSQEVKPYLLIETGAHTARVDQIAVDAAERFLVSASEDKTARVWDLRSGSLLKILRPPIGDDQQGRLFAVAISPDGRSVAVGGWTGEGLGRERQIAEPRNHPIYIFDRESGTIRTTIPDLPDVTNALAYSKDGRFLAAALGLHEMGTWIEGVRIYETGSYSKVAEDTDYGDASYWLEFDQSGRLVSTSLDGFVRLYRTDFHLMRKEKPSTGKQPYSVRFSPNGQLIAVGFQDAPTLDVLSGSDLSFQYSLQPPTAGKNLMAASWSADGRTLCAAGDYGDATNVFPVLCRSDAGKGEVSTFPVTGNAVTDIRALGDGGIAFAARDGTVGVLGPNHKIQWRATSDVLDFKRPIRISSDADTIEGRADSFNGAGWTYHTLRFSVTKRKLEMDPQGGSSLSGDFVLTPGLRIGVVPVGDGALRWYNTRNGEELLALFVDRDLKRWVAWNPDGFFAFEGAGDALIGYQINRGPGQAGDFVKVDQLRDAFYRPDLIAQILKPGGAEAIVAARNRIGDISKVLSAGLPPEVELISPDQAIVENEYLLQFRIKDRGRGHGRIVYRIDGAEIEGRGEVDIAGTGTDVNTRYVPVGSGTHSLTVTVYNAAGKIESSPKTVRITRSPSLVGSNLYVIAAGISHYSDHTLWEGVKFASSDADEIAASFKGQEGKGLYRRVTSVSLPDSRATVANIRSEVTRVAKTIRPGDTFVLYLAGHGIAADGEYYFIPWEAESPNQQALLSKSLNREAIQELLKQIPTSNSVLILDTCGAGAFLEGRGADERGVLDKLALMSGRSVLAASNTKEMAMEGYENHGVFTYVLLEGLEKAEVNDNGDILIDSLAVYLRNTVPRITNERWHLRQSPQISYQGAPFPIVRKITH